MDMIFQEIGWLFWMKWWVMWKPNINKLKIWKSQTSNLREVDWRRV